MNYSQALAYTQTLKRLGGSPGLACFARVLEKLDNPQQDLKVIHVAGTNGKGSVCTMTAAMLQQAGYKVGLYTSPYLVDFRERFRINGEMIPKETYARLANKVKQAVEQTGEELSQFSFITAVGLCWYLEEQCDAVVLETGLGGRLDATNCVASPMVTAITAVSLDHTELLGNTVEEIMAEKCGIMKTGGTTVLSPGQPVEAVAVAMEFAAKTGSRLILPNVCAIERLGDGIFRYGEETYTLSLKGDYQFQNAAVALEIVDALLPHGLTVSKDAKRRGLLCASHPGRCQVLREEPLILLDGAHNPAGAEALAQTLATMLEGKKAVGVCGVMHDKAARDLAGKISPYLDRVIAVTPANPRALPAKELAAVFAEYCPAVETGEVDAHLIQTIRNQTQPTVIFGSLYLAGELLSLW